MANYSNIVLIGMPGAGKSTLGVVLAKTLGMDFVDTDITIQQREGTTLQQIMDDTDYLNLRRIESEVLQDLYLSNTVIATGGSAVYSDAAMHHLKSRGVCIYLEASLEELTRRIHNYESRGIARAPDQTFQQVFDERCALYKHYADITLNCNQRDVPSAIEELMATLPAFHRQPTGSQP